MDYGVLKAVHVTCVVLSGSLFALRGAWRLARPDAPFARAVRVVPMLVDSALLLSAVGLASFWMRDRLPMGWIGVKVALLVLYIALGVVALRPGLPTGPRLAALGAAALTFGFIVSVALSKSPAGVLRTLLT
jgi:uncharacterized membrane protein SirB2